MSTHGSENKNPHGFTSDRMSISARHNYLTMFRLQTLEPHTRDFPISTTLLSMTRTWASVPSSPNASSWMRCCMRFQAWKLSDKPSPAAPRQEGDDYPVHEFAHGVCIGSGVSPKFTRACSRPRYLRVTSCGIEGIVSRWAAEPSCPLLK